MKRERKIKAMYAIGYTLLVALLFLGTRCESHPKITSPEHDSKYLESLAECITCETDLVIIEKLAREYEIAYRKGYNGAMATKFTELMVPVREMATARLDAIRAEDDYLKAQQAEFNGTLNDLDRAWQMDVATPEAAYAVIDANDANIAQLEASLAQLIIDKELYAEEIIDACYPADMLANLQKMEEQIVELRDNIAKVERENYIVKLAYRLQLGEELPERIVAEGEDATPVEEQVE